MEIDFDKKINYINTLANSEAIDKNIYALDYLETLKEQFNEFKKLLSLAELNLNTNFDNKFKEISNKILKDNELNNFIRVGYSKMNDNTTIRLYLNEKFSHRHIIPIIIKHFKDDPNKELLSDELESIPILNFIEIDYRNKIITCEPVNRIIQGIRTIFSLSLEYNDTNFNNGNFESKLVNSSIIERICNMPFLNVLVPKNITKQIEDKNYTIHITKLKQQILNSLDDYKLRKELTERYNVIILDIIEKINSLHENSKEFSIQISNYVEK